MERACSSAYIGFISRVSARKRHTKKSMVIEEIKSLRRSTESQWTGELITCLHTHIHRQSVFQKWMMLQGKKDTEKIDQRTRLSFQKKLV